MTKMNFSKFLSDMNSTSPLSSSLVASRRPELEARNMPMFHREQPTIQHQLFQVWFVVFMTKMFAGSECSSPCLNQICFHVPSKNNGLFYVTVEATS